MDFIVSLNFQHINKMKTKIMTPYINRLQGYNKEIAICSPIELIENEEEE